MLFASQSCVGGSLGKKWGDILVYAEQQLSGCLALAFTAPARRCHNSFGVDQDDFVGPYRPPVPCHNPCCCEWLEQLSNSIHLQLNAFINYSFVMCSSTRCRVGLHDGEGWGNTVCALLAQDMTLTLSARRSSCVNNFPAATGMGSEVLGLRSLHPAPRSTGWVCALGVYFRFVISFWSLRRERKTARNGETSKKSTAKAAAASGEYIANDDCNWTGQHTTHTPLWLTIFFGEQRS